jgi:hypothetical protein
MDKLSLYKQAAPTVVGDFAFDLLALPSVCTIARRDEKFARQALFAVVRVVLVADFVFGRLARPTTRTARTPSNPERDGPRSDLQKPPPCGWRLCILIRLCFRSDVSKSVSHDVVEE